MNKIRGKERAKLKMRIRQFEYQDRKFGSNDVEKARLQDLKNSLIEKV